MTDQTIPSAPPPPAPPPPVPAPAPIEGVPSAPYRAPADLAVASVTRASSAVTVWGPVLWTFGIVLWSYVVMGQLVTSYAPGGHSLLLGEGTAILFLLATSFVAWLVAVRRSLRASPAPGTSGRMARALVVGMLASMSWCTVTGGAAVAGQSASKNADGAVTVMLLVVAIAALLYGRRLSPPPDASPSPRARVFARIAWTGAALITLVALIALGASD